MNLKNFRALMLVGLAACGIPEESEDLNAPVDSVQSEQSEIIVGTLNWSSVTALSSTSTQRARSRAVGYIQIPAKGSRCTAWLIANDLVVTNNHCISTSADAVGARVSFNYEDGVASTSRIWYSCGTLVRTWSAEDMTVLRCSAVNGQFPGQVYGRLTVATTNAATGSGLYVIHQNCEWTANSSCDPTKKYSPGSVVNGNYSTTQLSHNGDTLGGSSGSPVLSATGHTVVGLHRAGSGANYSTTSFNLAVKASNMRARLAEIGL
jgi:V8-like Glu-specific endopeptidase